MADRKQQQQQQKFLQTAPAVREDAKAADQLEGAVETLNEKVPDDPVVRATLPKCVKFRTLLRQLLRELGTVEAAADKGEPLPADFNPSKAEALIEEWQKARVAFLDHQKKNHEYLETLALRVLRPR
jgi:hypothetical protein